MRMRRSLNATSPITNTSSALQRQRYSATYSATAERSSIIERRRRASAPELQHQLRDVRRAAQSELNRAVHHGSLHAALPRCHRGVL